MNVTDYLKDLDTEDQQLQQEIWRLQIRRQQIADTRVLMMQREEERAHAVGQPSPFGTFPNGATMAFRDPIAYRAEPRTPPAEQLAHQPPPLDEAAHERKKEHDRERYHAKKAAMADKGYVKKHDGTWGPRQRSLRADNGRPRKKYVRNTPENRAANEVIRDRVRTAMEHRVEPVASGDLVRAFGITDKHEKQRIYQAMNALASRGELKQVGVSEHGYTYLAAHVANGQHVA